MRLTTRQRSKRFGFTAALLLASAAFSISALPAASADNRELSPATEPGYKVSQSGLFTQSKKIVGLSRNLNSSGRYKLSEQRVLWTTTAPLYSDVLITGNSVQERYSADGKFQVTASGESVTTVSRILALIVRSDTEGLKRYFDIAETSTETTVSNELTPRSDALKSLFNKVLIEEFGAKINVRIYEASGTVTDIELTPSSG